MKKVNVIINLAIVGTGLELINRLLVTYNDPVIVGAIWISLVGFKCLLDVFKK